MNDLVSRFRTAALAALVLAVCLAWPPVTRAAAVASEPAGDLGRYGLPSLTDPDAQRLFREAVGHWDDHQPEAAFLKLAKAAEIASGTAALLSRAGCLGLTLSETHHPTARRLLERLATLKPMLVPAEALGLAQCLYSLEPLEFDRAEQLIAGVLKTHPEMPEALVAKGELALARQRFADALAAFAAAAKAAPQQPRARWGTAYSLLGLKRVDEASRAFLDAYALQSGTAEANERMGKAMADLGKPMMATKYFQQALDLDPNRLAAHVGLAGLMLEKNQDMSARRHLTAALKLDPGNPRLHLMQGMFEEMRGHLAPAIKAYETAAAYGPGYLDAKLRLIRIFAGIGHRFPGNTFSNDHPDDLWEYKECYNPRKALALVQEVLRLAPKHEEAASLTALAEKLEEDIPAPE